MDIWRGLTSSFYPNIVSWFFFLWAIVNVLRCLYPETRMIPKMSPNPEPEVLIIGSIDSPLLAKSRASSPRNKNRLPSPSLWTKMKDNPPLRQYLVFQAIWFEDNLILLALVIFNSIQKDSLSHITWTSGTPLAIRLSSLVANEFSGKFFLTLIQRFFSVVIFNFLKITLYKNLRILFL